ncbi:hypothetical protein JTE90_010170 [Oedothorax gibbosus]|uniref:FYVE-type zinc finger domain-containing protein n=1 Tax=Oedothorax gibbosus TaxID=931172 RepID=A0AAV6UBW3_9ARAC|nr:hypothetical protein JTE90_010170 [Oedothorax gibbosus]
MSINSHLKVELQNLKRSLAGGYGFDLTKFCAGCWNRTGRFLRRGLSCRHCRRRVCKSCRHFIDEKTWICVLCYKKQ